MSLVHYKFKSSLDYQNVKFDGLHISVGDLKKEIIAQKHLKLGDFELEISNAQTGSVYKNNTMLIPKNSSVIVSRVPAKPCQASSTQKSWEAYKQEVAKAKEQERQQLSLEQLKQTPDLANANASEIDKVMAAVAQSNRGFEPSNYTGKYHVHESYVCKGCGQSGHHIRNCPSKPEVLAPHIKRTTGIPHSFLTYVDDPLTPGALMTHRGQFAVPTIDAQAYKEGKKELPPFMPIHKGSEPEKPPLPKELKCRLCNDLMTDAVVIPCCGNSYCDECIRDKLLETEDHRCPTCGQYGVSPNGIIPNNHLRSAVMAFTNDSGYSKTRRKSLDSKASVLQSAARSRPPAQQPLYSQAPTNHQMPGEGQEHHRPAREQRRPAQSPVVQAGTYVNSIDAARREAARRQPIPSASSSAGHLPPTQSSSLGHLSQSSSSTSHLSATPPLTPHQHTTVAYSEPQRARAEAPPVYVSSTLTSADAASLYSSPETSAALGTYESDKEQMVNIAGAAVTRHVPREHEKYRSGEDHHHHHHHHLHHLPSAADLAYPPPHSIPTAGAAAAPLVYHAPPYPAMAAQPPAYLYPSLGIPVYPGYSAYPAAIPQPVPAQKRDVFDDFAKDIMEKKPDRIRSIRSHSRARSYTPRRSRTRSRSRMRSRSRSFKGRSRSASSRRSRLRSYSRGRSGSPRRSASRGRSPGLKSRSPGRARSPGKPRSPGRRSRSRGKSLTPIKRSRSLEKRSRTPTGKFRSPRKSSRSPGHRSPGRRSPGGRSPGRRSPGVRSPGRRSPGVRSPGIRSPGRRSPGARSPGRRSPGVRSPGRRSPGARSPERSPGARSPGRRSPGRRSPLRRSPGARSPGRRSPIGRSPGRRSPGGRSPVRRSPGRRSIGRRSRSFSRRRSMSLGRRRSRSPRSWSYRSPASRRRSFTPRRHRSFSRSRSRGTPRRSHTPHSRSRSWSTPRRKSYSVSPHRITKPLSPLRLGAGIRQRSASPFHRRSASPGGFVRRGMTPPQAGFQPFRGRGRGRGFRGRGAYRGDWPPVQHRQFEGRRQFNDQQFDSRQQYNNQFPQVPSSDELLRQQYDAYYRDYYAKFGPNAPPPPPFQAAANSQWNLNQVFQDGRPNQFPPSGRGGLHFQPRPPLLQLAWQQQQLQQHPVGGQQLHPQPLFPEHRQLPADVRARSAEPQPPGVDQPANRRDFQHEFTREREQGRELQRENSRDFPRDDRNRDYGRDSRNSRNYRDEQPKSYDRDQGRDYNRDSDRGYSRDAIKDDQTREYSKDSRDQDKGQLRDHSRDHKRDYRDNRERVRDHVHDRRDSRHTSDSREHHRVSSEKERKSKEKHGKEKKKTEKGTVEEKDKSKKKALKRVSSSDEKTPVPAKKSKKMKAADGTVQQSAESSKKVLAKKKKKTDKKGTMEADTALENNLLQVTVTKSEKIDKISSGSEKEKNKKVVRKVKKVKAAQPIAEGNAATSQPVEPETVKTELEPAVSAVEARVVQKEPADSTVAVKDEVEADLTLMSQKTESSQDTAYTTPSKEDLVIVEVCTEVVGDSGLKGDTEDELMLHPPELSKWEREDFDWDISDTTRPPKKVARIPDKVISMLPRSVLNRAETYMAKKPVKPTVSTPPGAKPQRRVYLEEKVEAQPEEKEERLVKTTKTSALEMQITVTKSDKRSPERSAKQERLGEDSRSVVRSSHVEDRSHNNRKRLSDDRYPSGDSSRHHRDSGSPRRESQDRRYRDREDYYHRSSRDRDDHLRDKGTRISRNDQGRSEHRDRAVANSRDRKQIGGKSPPRDLRQKLEQSRGHPAKESNAVKPAQRALDRKESVIDESKFEPDYIEIEETSDSSDEGTAADSHLTLSTEEASDADGSQAKKVVGDEDGKKKHKKERKHKKDKKNKKKKKKKDKKHKKEKDKKGKTE